MFRRPLLASVIVALAAQVCAQQPGSNVTSQLPAVVVMGTRIPTELDTSPNSVTVVSRDEIEQQQLRTVADVLREQPGVDILRNGQPGGVTSVSIRGANPNQTLVLIDGIPVNSAFNNAFDFANLPVDNIDHIEVLHGPQSTLYGSEALGGVINIVTKQCVGKPTGSVLVEGGSDDSIRARGSFAANHDKFCLSAETSYFTTDNERSNSEYRVWNASGHATWQLLDRLNAGVLASYLQSKAGSPNDRFTNDPNDFLRNENAFVAGSLDGEPADWWRAELKLSHSHERQFFSGLEPNPPLFLGDFAERTVAERNQVDFQNVFAIADAHKLLFGGTYGASRANDTNTFGSLSRSVDDKAVYAQYEFAPTPRFTAALGGRVDDYTTFGTHGTYKFGARYTVPHTETILRASVGTGFRAPTVRDFFPPYGNPNLKPEQSLGWDAGIEQPLANNKLRIGATYFQNEFDDLIQAAYPAPVNTGRAETIGMETFATWTPTTNLTLRGTYTWLPRAEDLNANERLIRRPEHNGSLSGRYAFLRRFAATADATLVGTRVDQNFFQANFPPYTAPRVSNPGYVRIDLGLRCDVTSHFAIFGRIENLLGDHYEEVFGFPALGRTFWGGGTVGF
jgi:vitamin B12 transporter